MGNFAYKYDFNPVWLKYNPYPNDKIFTLPNSEFADDNFIWMIGWFYWDSTPL